MDSKLAEALRPCPFCGAGAVNSNVGVIYCSACHCEAYGIERWNRRTAIRALQPASKSGLGEALDDLCRSVEYSAGCDEGVDPDTAYSEIMSFAGVSLAVSYSNGRTALAEDAGR